MSTAAIPFKLLTDDYFENYIQHHKVPFTPIGEFTYYRTYSPFDYELKRRETAHETFRRAVEYNCYLVENIKPVEQSEATKLFENMTNLKQSLSGRTLWVGGRDVSLKYPMSNFNCSFGVIEAWEDFCDMFYLLMLGVGAGHRELPADVEKIPSIRTDVTLWWDNYIPVPKEERNEYTELQFISKRHARIVVGDSKEGWVQALGTYFTLLTHKDYRKVQHISLDFSHVRPKGERLRTFGGTASGYQSLKDMFVDIHRVLLDRGEIVQASRVKITSVDVLDIANIIGANVVVGGVRRTSENGLGHKSDRAWVLAKYGINGWWTDVQKQKAREAKELIPDLPDSYPANKQYRRMSNNSIYYEEKPTRKELHEQFIILRQEGEPCFLNAEQAKKRKRWFAGVNPCFEILLSHKGLCNLTTVVVMAFVYYENGVAKLDLEGLLEAQRLSARAGVRMTCVELELPKWDYIQKRDRLVGCSLTAWQDAVEALDLDEAQQIELLKLLHKTARDEANEYAEYLGIPQPELVTTIKPEGTWSIVAGARSPGVHHSHAPFYYRRIRINATDPLAKAVLRHKGWIVTPENGEDWVEHWTIIDENSVEIPNLDFMDKDEAENACAELNGSSDFNNDGKVKYQVNHYRPLTTLVIMFPVKSPVKRTKYDVSAIEQLETYLMFQKYYTEHNTSNTISIKNDEEWDQVEDWMWQHWDEIIAVSFISLKDSTYKQLPYEAITEQQYCELFDAMQPFDMSILEQFDTGEDFDIGNEGCEGGLCPVR